MTTSPEVMAAGSKPVGLDQNRVALLADTHISADPNRVYPGTKWPGSPVKEDEHESVHIANSLIEAAKGVIELNPRPAHLIVNGDCALSNGKEAEYKQFLRLIEPIRAGVACPSGGIGRRARFRFLSRQLGGGSNPLSGIPVVGAYQFQSALPAVSIGLSYHLPAARMCTA